MPLRCPRDRADLVIETSEGFRVERCPLCAGLVVTVAMLRRIATAERVNSLWRSVSAGSPGDRCPSCPKRLSTSQVHIGAREIELDACRTCQLLWFDADELAAFAPKGSRPSPAAAKERLSPAAAEAMARSEIELRRQGRDPEIGSALKVDFVIAALDALLHIPF